MGIRFSKTSHGSLISCLLPSCFLSLTGLVVYLGMMGGAFVLGGLADKLGRKRVLSISLAINASFASLSSFVQGYGAFLFCRLISGIGYVITEVQLAPPAPRPSIHPGTLPLSGPPENLELNSVFKFLAVPHRMWYLSSPTRNQTHASCSRRQSLNHWTTREVPEFLCDFQNTVLRLNLRKGLGCKVSV